MNTKTKHKKMKKARQQRRMLLNLGLVVALSLTLVAFEWNFQLDEFRSWDPVTQDIDTVEWFPPVPIPPTDVPEPIQDRPQPPDINADINVVDDNTEEQPQDSVVFAAVDTISDNRIVILNDGPPEDTVPILDLPDLAAEPKCGWGTFQQIVGRNVLGGLRPIDKRRLTGINSVYVLFIVDEKGKVAKTEILKGIDPYIDRMVMENVIEATDWTPAKAHGRKVSQRFRLPIVFKVN